MKLALALGIIAVLLLSACEYEMYFLDDMQDDIKQQHPIAAPIVGAVVGNNAAS